MEGDTYLGKYVPGAFSAVYNISGYKYKVLQVYPCTCTRLCCRQPRKPREHTYLGRYLLPFKYVPGAFSAVYNISGYKYKGILAIRTNF
jgi:hypothetical protein